MINKNLKYYEKLIERELASLTTSKQAESGDEAMDQYEDLLPKKKKLKKEVDKKKHQLDHLELVIGIYKLLIFNFAKYSTKYNFSKLISLVQFESSDQRKKDETSESDLVKYVCLKISSLLLNLSPIQEENLFNKQFTNEQLENVNLK
jgi:hypothetical protein